MVHNPTNDPQIEALVGAALAGAADPASLGVLADYLEAKGDPRRRVIRSAPTLIAKLAGITAYDVPADVLNRATAVSRLLELADPYCDAVIVAAWAFRHRQRAAYAIATLAAAQLLRFEACSREIMLWQRTAALGQCCGDGVEACANWFAAAAAVCVAGVASGSPAAAAT